jgi:hypothetical protein
MEAVVYRNKSAAVVRVIVKSILVDMTRGGWGRGVREGLLDTVP